VFEQTLEAELAEQPEEAELAEAATA